MCPTDELTERTGQGSDAGGVGDRDRDHSSAPAGGTGDVDRRTVLRGIGVAGVGLGASRVGSLGGGTAAVGGLESTAARSMALSDGVRPVPVRGCDASVGDAACTDGSVGLYERGGEIGLGQYTYQLTLNDVPMNLFTGPLDYHQFMIAGGAGVRRIPEPPPSAPLDWGPYELLFPAGSISLGANEDLAAPVRLVPPDCEVPPACRERWCDAVEQTVDALKAQRRVLETELFRTNAELTSRPFSVTVPQKGAEQAARLRLRAKVNSAIATEATLLRGRMAQNRPIPDLPDVCGDCPACVQLPRAHRVREWELRITERSDATWTTGEKRNWARHELRTRSLLEPPGIAGAAHASGLSGPLGGVVASVLGLLNGLSSAVGNLFGGGGRPKRRSWMGKPIEATGWVNHGYVADTDDGTIGVINNAAGTVTDPAELTQFSDLRMFFEDDQYELSVPEVPLPGTSLTFGLPRNQASSFESLAGWGNVITRRAAREGVSGATRATDEAGGAARFPLSSASECGSGLSHRVEIDLDGRGIIQGGSEALPAELGPQGTASVEWELVPQAIEDGEMKRIDCL